MRWTQPSRAESQLWLAQFNEMLAALTKSDFDDEGAASAALFALSSLLEAEVAAADLVAGLVVALLFKTSNVLAPERAREAVALGLRAERLRVDDDEDRPLQRAYLHVACGRIDLADGRPFGTLDHARLGARQLPETESAAPTLGEYLRALNLLLEADAWDAVLEPGRAAAPYDRASALGARFVEEQGPSVNLFVDIVSFLYGADAGEEIARATLQSLWHDVASLQLDAAAGRARCRALLGDPGTADAARQLTALVRQLGPGATDPFRLVPVVRQLDPDTAGALIDALVEQSEAVGADGEGFGAVLNAVAAVSVREAGGDAAALLAAAREACDLALDELVVAAAVGWTAVAEQGNDVGPPGAPVGSTILDALGGPDAARDPRLRDLRVRAAFDEPLALALEDVAQRFEEAGDEAARVDLSRLIDGLWETAPPFDALLRGAASPAVIEDGAAALDRLGRLEAGLRNWPGAAAIMQREFASSTLFVCVAAGSPAFVVRAGPSWREAAARLAAAVEREIVAIDLVGSPGPASMFDAPGRGAFAALPAAVRELIVDHDVVLLCPDYRTNGDSIPFELFHDGSDWLGLSKVLSRFPSLGALTRSVEGTARRHPDRRAVVLAVPHAEGFDDLRFAAEESAWVRQQLVESGWDASEIAAEDVSPSFVVDRLPLATHVHIAAHGDATGHDEGLIVAGGERLRTDDLLSRFFPRLPTVYLNTCSLAATRYVGGGVSRGVALALAERGAGAVVANLLPVDDSSSSELARAFYASREPFGEALRAARATVAAGGATPLFWGTTVLLGDPRTTLLPSRTPATLAERVLDSYFSHFGGPDEDAIAAAERVLGDGTADPRVTAAVALVREVAAWPPGEALDPARTGAALRLALELDHLPASAMVAWLIVDSIDDDEEHDRSLRAVEECLMLVEPLEAEGDTWQRLLDQLLARWNQLQRGTRRIEQHVTGSDNEEEAQEMMNIGKAITDAQLAVEARALRGGYGVEVRDENGSADVCWNAVVSRHDVDLDDMSAVAAYAQLVVRRLVAMGAVRETAAPLADTAVAGLLLWLWLRQPAASLPPEFAEGQAGMLEQLLESVATHWPPEPAAWFATIEPFREETSTALAALEGMPYDDHLYPLIEETIDGIADRARSLLAQVRADDAERVPDAAAWIFGTLVKVNTYSPMDGSVPEHIGGLLYNAYVGLWWGGHGEELFMPWLKLAFEQVSQRTPDDLERWRYGFDRAGRREADVGDDADDWSSLSASAPRLSRAERVARIEELLDVVATDTMDELPEGLLEAIQDESDLAIVENSLDPDAPIAAVANAVRAIGILADAEWTEHVVASPDTSIPRIVALYEATTSRKLRRLMIHTLCRFDPTDVPFEFLLDRLAEDHVELKGEILAELQHSVDRPYLHELVHDRLLGLLHGFCDLPLRASMYTQELFGEMDVRFWVFRCLRMIASPESVPVIENYLDTHDWPLDTLAEAVHAHWALTHRLDYLPVLREAKAHNALGNTESALKAMEKEARARAKQAKPTPPPATKPKSRTRPRDAGAG